MSLTFNPTYLFHQNGEVDGSIEKNGDNILCYEEACVFEYRHGSREKAVEYLSNENINIDVDDDDGILLIYAAQANDTETLKLLLEKGATVSLCSALTFTAQHGNIEATKLLIEHGADPRPLRGTTCYNNHAHMKAFLDQMFAEKLAH